MRTAIDKFKDAADAGMIPTTELKANSEGYPPDLETLVDGVSVANDASGRKLKFLRKIPLDPLTGDSEWGRSEEHTSELQSQSNLVCRVLIEKKNNEA